MDFNEIIDNLLNSADDTCCSEDLKVIKKECLAPFEIIRSQRENNLNLESTKMIPSFYTVVYGNVLDGTVFEGLFIDMDSAIKYAETHQGESEWHVSPIFILH